MAGSSSLRIGNKIKRSEQHVKRKKEKESTKRDERLKRRRHEDKNPDLRAARQSRNVPATIDSKRTWDEVDPDEGEEGAALGRSVDILRAKRRRVEEPEAAEDVNGEEAQDKEPLDNEDDDLDSMLGSDSDSDAGTKPAPPVREPSEAPSIATDLALTPESLSTRFPALFDPPPDQQPKVLITTSLNSALHQEGQMLTTLFPHSTYIKRSAHAHAYKYSIREIAKYAHGREYTHLVILNQALHVKEPSGLDIVLLPGGPMFHFSISHFVAGKKLPGHGNPTNHYPELILNGFKTPLGLLTAHLFKSLFPPHPEIQGRQVVTLHNQRDYIFLRRHRYVFRDKRATEKQIQGTDGKPMKGVEEVRAGLQELGPRFTMKLRRVDRGVQRGSGQEWEWKGGDEKVRTRFSL
ncbi:hypothetical protein B0A48_09708 [Cryoendolithus antarcticus]|uniref:Brix domain-containing protein n=1 Tax=Cryoendolithus antarcticus TaxID=1507870 RepID=A0A1V8T0C5_9PEZI|nr:hypothetical protein B0A48_09708 [Cryoendolithus antarcticus]